MLVEIFELTVIRRLGNADIKSLTIKWYQLAGSGHLP